MKTKLVKRHWCDFCNKAGLQAHAMAKHEKHCTLNPARDCRVCGLLGGSVRVGVERMALLVEMLPDPTEYLASPWVDVSEVGMHQRFTDSLQAAMKELRKEVDDCPACIMAALRQKKIPVPMVDGFDFKSEMQSILNERNQSRYDDGYY